MMKVIKNLLSLSLFISLLVSFGCDKNKDKDNQDTWIHITGYDFPINVSHFADYTHTDDVGNVSERVHYGTGGDNNDWKLFEYQGKGSSAPKGITGLTIPDIDYGRNVIPNPITQIKSGNPKDFYNHGTIYPGIPETVQVDTLGFTATFTFNTPSLDVEPTTPIIQYTGFLIEPPMPAKVTPKVSPYCGFGVILSTASATDHAQLSVTVPSGIWGAMAFYNGQYHNVADQVVGPASVSWEDLPFSDTVQLMFMDLTYPVPPPPDLMSFTGVCTIDHQVQLQWVTQYIQNYQGFNLYRGDNSVLAEAVKINPELIVYDSTAGSEVTYSFLDADVEIDNTYYYWLEIINANSDIEFHGPISVTITPDLTNRIKPAYPNPCTGWFSVPFSITDSARVSIVILNKANDAVLSWQNYYEAGSYNSGFNMSDLPAGLYRAFIWIKMNNKSYYSYGDVLKNDE